MSPKIGFPLIAIIFVSILFTPAKAQENSTTDAVPPTVAVERAPTAAEMMRQRISKAKAMLAVKNFPAAEYELKNLKRESSDKAVLRVVNVLLMHTYLEQSDYPEAQKLISSIQISDDTDSALDFLAVAGQVVNGAKEQSETYKSLGLSLNDRNLPTVAIADLEGMRTTLELVIDRSKQMTEDDNLRANAAALLEGSTSARAILARDAYDAKRWHDAVADAREQMIGSRSVILNAVTPPVSQPKEANVAASRIPEDKPAENTGPKAGTDKLTFKPVMPEKKPSEKPTASAERKTIPILGNTEVAKKPDQETAKTEKTDPPKTDSSTAAKKGNDGIQPTDRPVRVIRSAKKTPKSATSDDTPQPNVRSTIDEDDIANSETAKPKPDGPMTVGSLIGYATRRVSPVYPRQARNLRLEGIVRVTVTVNEDGTVAKVDDADGPAMLTQAASDAIRKWKFRPFKRDGEPVKATGFISFNFSL